MTGCYFLLFCVATLSAKSAANLSTLFDFGGIFGGIIAGVISDVSGMNATCCAAMLGIAIPMVKPL
jgi:OPA family glycerol-3-phosphate transporter-like MFS transporter 1/2